MKELGKKVKIVVKKDDDNEIVKSINGKKIWRFQVCYWTTLGETRMLESRSKTKKRIRKNSKRKKRSVKNGKN